MRKLITSLLFVATALLGAQTAAASKDDPLFMILEQTAAGNASHDTLDTAQFPDGIDPILAHIFINSPTDPRTAQVLWAASEEPARWIEGSDNNEFLFVEHAILPQGSKIEYRVYYDRYDFEIAMLRHSRTSSDWRIDPAVIEQLSPGLYRVEARVNVPNRPEQKLIKRIDVVRSLDTSVPSAPEAVAPDATTAEFIDTPLFYVKGSGVDIRFDVDNLPANGDVLILAWSVEQVAMVKGFGHALGNAPWAVTSDKLDTLPTGKVELQLIVRDAEFKKYTHEKHVVHILDPLEAPAPDEAEIAEPDAGDGLDQPGTNESDTDSGAVSAPTGPAGLLEESLAPGLSVTTAGFTKLTKSADTHVIYVSSSQGNDNNDGASPLTPVKTLDHATSLMRSNKPDWLLLKAGDTWKGESFSDFNVSGRSAQEPMVIGVYGEGPRPLIIPAHGSNGLNITDSWIEGLVVQGLHIYGQSRDPYSPNYLGRPGGNVGIKLRINAKDAKYCKSLVIEDCVVTHFDTNIELVDDWTQYNGDSEGGDPGRLRCIVRRNVLRYATGEDSHSVGLYIEGTNNSVIEQNVFDHNGWHPADGEQSRNKRSHNIYAQKQNGPMLVRDNIIARGASHGLQLRAGGVVERNLFVRNAAAFYCSRNDSKALYNVIIESTNRYDGVDGDKTGHLGYGIEGWGMGRYELVGNIVARRLGNVEKPGITAYAGTIVLKNNTVYDWYNQSGDGLKWEGQEVVILDNLSPDQLNGVEPKFVDPGRSVGDYAGTVGIEPTLEAFLNAASARPRGVWSQELAPSSVCNYIREGFKLSQ